MKIFYAEAHRNLTYHSLRSKGLAFTHFQLEGTVTQHSKDTEMLLNYWIPRFNYQYITHVLLH